MQTLKFANCDGVEQLRKLLVKIEVCAILTL